MPLETNLDQRLAADAEDVKAERRLKEAVRRYYALAELIDTERGYVDDLKILVEVSETFHSARLVLFSFPRSFHISSPCLVAAQCSVRLLTAASMLIILTFAPETCYRDATWIQGQAINHQRCDSQAASASLLFWSSILSRFVIAPSRFLFGSRRSADARTNKQPRGGNDSSSMPSSPLSTTIARSDTRWRLLASHYLSS